MSDNFSFAPQVQKKKVTNKFLLDSKQTSKQDNHHLYISQKS